MENLNPYLYGNNEKAYNVNNAEVNKLLKFDLKSNDIKLNNLLIEREFGEIQSHKSNSFSMVNNENEYFKRTNQRYGSHGKEKTSKFAKFFKSNSDTGELVNDLKKNKNKTSKNLNISNIYLDDVEKNIFVYYKKNKSCYSSYKNLVVIKDNYDVNDVTPSPRKSRSLKKSSSNTNGSSGSNYYCCNVQNFKTSNINNLKSKKSHFYQVENNNKAIATTNLEIKENARKGRFLKSLIDENFNDDFISNESSNLDNSIEIFNNNDKNDDLNTKTIEEDIFKKNKCRFLSSKSMKKKLNKSTIILFKIETQKYSKSVSKQNTSIYYSRLFKNYNSLSSISSISYHMSKSFSYSENSNGKIIVFKTIKKSTQTSKSNFNLTKSLHVTNNTNSNNMNTINFDSMTIDISNKLFNTNSVNLMINEVNNLVNYNYTDQKMKDIQELSIENMLTTTELLKGKY